MQHEVFTAENHARAVADRIAYLLTRGARNIVLTGGTTAEKVYGHLGASPIDMSGVEVFFSDERCVPPTDDASNYLMAKRTLLDSAHAANVHRMRGEDPPEEGASAYDRELTAFEDVGFDLVLLGMGADCHIGAIYPESPALDAPTLCAAVDRPDGMKGLTLTARSIVLGARTLVIVAGENKAKAVRRALDGDETPRTCPVRLLAGRPNVHFLLDEGAASLL